MSDLDLTRLFNLDTAVVPVGKRETRRKRFDKTIKEIDTVLIDDDDEGDDEVEIIEPLCSVAQADDPDSDIELIEVDLENAEETFWKVPLLQNSDVQTIQLDGIQQSLPSEIIIIIVNVM